ncbi:MAG: NAD(P)/FAD-dependent oxidoreductase [Granulosicoccus sp.]
MTDNNQNQLPHQTQIVVIGGGVVGVSAALLLNERGIPVVLCEKGRIAGEQSSRNWGWIRRQGRDIAELPLMEYSRALWARLAKEVDQDIGFRIGGVSYIGETEADMHRYETWLSSARELVADSKLLSRKEANTLAGRNDQHFLGGLITPGDAYAEPSLAVPAMARLARSRGVQIFENTAVRALQRQGGKITGAITERGVLNCQSVILAGGVWSRTLLENEGLSFAQLAVKASVLRTSKVSPVASCTLGAASAALRPRADGGYTIARFTESTFELVPAAISHLPAFFPMLRTEWKNIKVRAGRSFFGPLGRQRWQAEECSPFEAVRTMNPEPDEKLLSDVMRKARELFPALHDATPVETWAGMIDFTPDEIAVVSKIDNTEGLILASGMSGHGFGFGPGAGLLAAQLAINETPVVDPAPLSLSRFRAA